MANFSTDEKITIEDQEIERVEEYKYLGQTLRLRREEWVDFKMTF